MGIIYYILKQVGAPPPTCYLFLFKYILKTQPINLFSKGAGAPSDGFQPSAPPKGEHIIKYLYYYIYQDTESYYQANNMANNPHVLSENRLLHWQ